VGEPDARGNNADPEIYSPSRKSKSVRDGTCRGGPLFHPVNGSKETGGRRKIWILAKRTCWGDKSVTRTDKYVNAREVETCLDGVSFPRHVSHRHRKAARRGTKREWAKK